MYREIWTVFDKIYLSCTLSSCFTFILFYYFLWSISIGCLLFTVSNLNLIFAPLTVRAADALVGVARRSDGVGSAPRTIIHCERMRITKQLNDKNIVPWDLEYSLIDCGAIVVDGACLWCCCQCCQPNIGFCWQRNCTVANDSYFYDAHCNVGSKAKANDKGRSCRQTSRVKICAVKEC